MSLHTLPRAGEIVAAQDRWLAWPGWPALQPPVTAEGPWAWIQANHRNNSLLWAEEDLARRTTVPDAEIAANKRAIDRYNQARNDATERVDELLLLALGLVDEASARSASPMSRVPPGARLNSETAKAMLEQTRRRDVDQAHVDASQAKWARLQEQRSDLGACLDALLAETAAGKAFFKVYRQFKMYNDPQLNPQLVRERPPP